MAPAVNLAGLIMNMLACGFGLFDVISEFIDNSIKAGASQLQFYLDTTTKKLYVSDNGRGMGAAKATESHILHNRTEASTEGQGFFGAGLKHALIWFTEYQFGTTCITRTVAEGLLELFADWRAAVYENGTLAYPPREPTRTNEGIWNERTLDTVHGTVFVVPCTAETFNQLLEAIRSETDRNNILKHIGKTYYDDLCESIDISFVIDGTEEYEVEPIDTRRREEATVQQSVEIDVWEHPVTKDARAYFKNGRNQYTRYEFNEKSLSKSKQIQETVPEGYVKIDSATIESFHCYDVDAKKASAWTNDEGEEDKDMVEFLAGRHYKRMKKIIDRMPIVDPGSGDFERRIFYTNSSHILTFGPKLDKYADVQVNKSHIKESNVHSAIRNTYHLLTEKWIDNEYKKYKKAIDDKIPLGGVVYPEEPPQPQSQPRPQPQPQQPQQPQEPQQQQESQQPQQVQEPPQPVQAPVRVADHLREQSKSPANVVYSYIRLHRKYTDQALSEKLARASPVPKAGLVEYVKLIEALEEILDAI